MGWDAILPFLQQIMGVGGAAGTGQAGAGAAAGGTAAAGQNLGFGGLIGEYNKMMQGQDAGPFTGAGMGGDLATKYAKDMSEYAQISKMQDQMLKGNSLLHPTHRPQGQIMQAAPVYRNQYLKSLLGV